MQLAIAQANFFLGASTHVWTGRTTRACAAPDYVPLLTASRAAGSAARQLSRPGPAGHAPPRREAQTGDCEAFRSPRGDGGSTPRGRRPPVGGASPGRDARMTTTAASRPFRCRCGRLQPSRRRRGRHAGGAEGAPPRSSRPGDANRAHGRDDWRRRAQSLRARWTPARAVGIQEQWRAQRVAGASYRVPHRHQHRRHHQRGDDIFNDSVNVAARVEERSGEAGWRCLSGSARAGSSRARSRSRLMTWARRNSRTSGARAFYAVHLLRCGKRGLAASKPKPLPLPGTNRPSPSCHSRTQAAIPSRNTSWTGSSGIITALSRFKSLFVIARNSRLHLQRQSGRASSRSVETRCHVLEGAFASQEDAFASPGRIDRGGDQ